jgi:hypothetical protein
VRTPQFVCDALVRCVLSLAMSSFAVVGCSTAPSGDDTRRDASNDAGAGMIEATDGRLMTDATTDGSDAVADGGGDQEAGMVDADASDATSFDGPPADAGGPGLDAQRVEGGGTLCGASCGPGQMLCPSPPFAGSSELGNYAGISQAGFTACFPESDAGCAGLNNEICGGGEVACPTPLTSVCAPGLTNCPPGFCYDLTSDTRGCGTCGNICAPATNGSAVCIDSKCVVACLPGWTACGTTCSVTTADASNCGACGRACAAGEICTGSTCVPQSSAWLVTGLASPSEINVDQNNVYWSDSTLNSISGIPKNGGPTFVIVPPQSTALTSLVFDDMYLYYWRGPTIMRALKDGIGSPQVVATIAMQGLALGVDSTSVYFTGLPSSDPPTIQRAPKGGGIPTTYLTTTLPGQFLDAISDNLAMYVMVNDGQPIGGMGEFGSYYFAGTVGGPDVRGQGLVPPGYHMGVDASNVYGWYEYGLVAIGKNSGFEGVASGISPPYSGGLCGVAWANSSGINWNAFVSMRNSIPYDFFEQAAQLIAPGVGPVVNLIADGDNIYWTDKGHGAIGRLRLP